MLSNELINKIYKKKLLMANPFAYYKINENLYFLSVDKILTKEELEKIFINNIYTLEESEIKNI